VSAEIIFLSSTSIYVLVRDRHGSGVRALALQQYLVAVATVHTDSVTDHSAPCSLCVCACGLACALARDLQTVSAEMAGGQGSLQRCTLCVHDADDDGDGDEM